MFGKVALCYCVVLLCLGTLTSAAISTFNNQELVPGQFAILRKGMYSKEDARTASLFFAQERSLVRFSLSLKHKNAGGTASSSVQVLLFHADDFRHIGERSPDGTQMLCDSEGQFIGTKTKYDRLLSQEISVPGTFKHIYEVTKSGIYYVIMVTCAKPSAEPSVSATERISIDGQISFRNPYGYLDAEEFGLLPFFGILSILYLLVALSWAVMNMLNWRDLIRLQMLISGVFFLSMLETLLFYLHYNDTNSYGSVSTSLLSSANFVGLVRKTCARLLVLVVSLGFAMIKETLGTTSYSILIYGFVYFFCSCLSQITHIMYWKIRAITPLTASLLSLPVVLCDVAFYVWIVLNISKTVNQLQIRKQTSKLAMYSAFRWLLLIYFAVSALWSGYESYLQITTNREEHDKRWETNWTTEAFWHLTYFAAITTVMLIFRPSNNNLRFAHSVMPVVYEGLPDADEEETESFNVEVELTEDSAENETGSVVVTKNVPLPETMSKTPKVATTNDSVSPVPSATEKKKAALTGFGLEEDEEEEPAKIE